MSKETTKTARTSAYRQFDTRSEINCCGVLKVQDPARLTVDSLGRPMNDERPHCHDAPGSSQTFNRPNRAGQPRNLSLCKNTCCMGARQHTKRTILPRRIIEMHAKRDDAAECGGRSDRVKHSCFGRPRPPRRVVDASAQWQNGVLVPAHQPIRRLRFVEQRGTKWKCR